MTPKTDLVGVGEAAEILGIQTSTIPRYVKANRLPKPVAELAATKIWRRADIEAVRDGKNPRPSKLRDVVGTSESAVLLGTGKSQVGRWMRAGVFPEPYARLAAGPIWRRADIERFEPPSRRSSRTLVASR